MMLPLLMALVATPTAEAKKKNQGPFMWGVGPTVSTIALPARYPSALPKDARDNVEGARGDIGLGVRGVAYLDREWRGAARLKLGTGSSTFSDVQATIEVDKILAGQSGFKVYVGGGLGFGNQRFQSDNGNHELKMGTLLLRAQAGGHYKAKTSLVEFSFFLVYPHPLIQTYVNPNTGDDGTEVTGGFYPQFGPELTVYFGDFTPPKKKKKGNKKGNNNNR